jgi:heme A synthase
MPEGSATSPEGSIIAFRVDDAAALGIQLTHRGLAFLLFLHVVAFAIVVTRRGERGPAVRAAQAAVLLVILQLTIAAALVSLHLPPALQSLHQAVGTMLWVVLVTCTVLARRGREPGLQAAVHDVMLPSGAPA